MMTQVKAVLNNADLSQIGQKKKDDDKTKEVEKALDIYKDLESVYEANWKIPVYALDPAFHAKVAQIKERLRATKTYRDENYFIDPMSWTWEKQLKQDVNDHKEAVERAAEHFDLEGMKEHSKVVADAAQASADLAPIAVAKNTTVGEMVADHQRQKFYDGLTKSLSS